MYLYRKPQDTRIRFRIHQNTPKYTKIHQNTVFSQDTTEYIRIHQDTVFIEPPPKSHTTSRKPTPSPTHWGAVGLMGRLRLKLEECDHVRFCEGGRGGGLVAEELEGNGEELDGSGTEGG